jgi:hypothetical protein
VAKVAVRAVVTVPSIVLELDKDRSPREDSPLRNAYFDRAYDKERLSGSDPFNPLNPLLSNEGINLKDKKDELAGSHGQKASPKAEAPKGSSFSTALPKSCASSAKGPKFAPGQRASSSTI